MEKYFDRDLSWLSFNYRVLMEALDESNPLYERIKFLAIYSSNLDEFVRVRLASIREVMMLGKKNIMPELDEDPEQAIQTIRKTLAPQLDTYGNTFREKVIPQLAENGIILYTSHEVLEEHKPFVLDYFKTYVLTYLKPIIFGEKENPFLNNQALYLAVRLKSGNDLRYGYVNIPTDKLSRFLALPQINGKFYYLFLDDVVRLHLDFVFPNYEIEECQGIKLNKDADLQIKDEYSGDLVKKIEKNLSKRNLGAPSRFLYTKGMSSVLLDIFKTHFNLIDEDLVEGGRYHSLFNLFELPNPLKDKLEIQKWPSAPHKSLESHRTVFSAIEEKDQLLHFPYHSYKYVLQFFNEAALDPYVTNIYVTFYRMAPNSIIGDSLISAAQNGKQVTVFMELKARFDEENNLKWASKMENAGVKIIYSIPGLKVHAKVGLVKKKLGDGTKLSYGFYGTGNLNEKTARLYCDHGLFSANKEMNKELEGLFKYLHKRKPSKPFENLLVSQFNILDRFKSLIDTEIAKAKKGEKAFIFLKMNNLEDKEMIDKLYEADQAGVDVQLITRSICCLRPGVKGLSDGIKVKRIIDRYLEHARIFIFGTGSSQRIFMGSADWMIRNLRHRIEVIFPIYDKGLKEQILHTMDLQWQDNVKAVWLDSDMNNLPVKRADGEKAIEAQLEMHRYVELLH